MKKTKLQFEKLNGKLIPVDVDSYYAMLATVKNEERLNVEYSTIRSNKSKQQLGFLFGAVYPFMVYNLRELQGDVLYYREYQSQKFPVLCTVDSVDTLFKLMYEETTQKEVEKAKMNSEEMSEYIDWLDKYAFENFGYGIPTATQKEE